MKGTDADRTWKKIMLTLKSFFQNYECSERIKHSYLFNSQKNIQNWFQNAPDF